MISIVGPRILVKLEKLEEVDELYKAAKAAGIEIPRSQDLIREEQAVTYGVVLQIGLEAYKPPVGDGTPWCTVGDSICFARYAGRFIEDPEDKITYLILNDEDVLAIISKETKND